MRGTVVGQGHSAQAASSDNIIYQMPQLLWLLLWSGKRKEHCCLFKRRNHQLSIVKFFKLNLEVKEKITNWRDSGKLVFLVLIRKLGQKAKQDNYDGSQTCLFFCIIACFSPSVETATLLNTASFLLARQDADIFLETGGHWVDTLLDTSRSSCIKMKA